MTPSSPYTIRRATLDDLPTLLEMRRAMFLDMGHKPDVIEESVRQYTPWVSDRLASGEVIVWFMCDGDGTPVGSVLAWFVAWLPGSGDYASHRVYVANVYVRPDHRRKGLAHRLMETVIAEARARGLRTVFLHASEEGRALYESLGFQRTTHEYRLRFPKG
jgi:GNAT superfamily N-acetyltransferase